MFSNIWFITGKRAGLVAAKNVGVVSLISRVIVLLMLLSDCA